MISVLFDIDLTLIDTDQAGREALNIAFEEAYGVRRAFDGAAFQGRTDLAIVGEALRRNDAAGLDGVEAAFVRRYTEVLAQVLTPGRGRVLRGVEPLLRRLQADERVALGIATGNFRDAAWLKLSRYGLSSFFLAGGFGDDHVDRAEVVSMAADRVAEAWHTDGRIRAADRVAVVGDSHLDVRAARANGFLAIAVATGLTPRADLEAAGADVVVSDLADTDAVVRILKTGTAGRS